MKDMRKIYLDENFVLKGEEFDRKYEDRDCSKKWGKYFKNIFLESADYKCPI